MLNHKGKEYFLKNHTYIHYYCQYYFPLRFSMGYCVGSLSCVQLFAVQWAVAHQAPLSMEFPRQEYWSGLPLATPGDLPDPAIESMYLASPTLGGGFFATSTIWKAPA